MDVPEIVLEQILENPNYLNQLRKVQSQRILDYIIDKEKQKKLGQ